MEMEKWRPSFYCLAKTQIIQLQRGQEGASALPDHPNFETLSFNLREIGFQNE